jgi:ABC-type transport system involved in multi-copper enzyme maturation permease subunit
MNESRHQGVAPAARRIRLVAAQTLGEAMRMRLANLLAGVAALLVVGSYWLREFNFGTAELAFIGDFGLGVIGLLGTVLAALAAAQLFFNDISAGAAACILTRPVRRWEYLAGKFAGVAGLLALFTAMLGGLLGGLMLWRGSQLGAPLAGLPVFLSACALQWMKFTLVAAMTLGVSAYAGSALLASCVGLLLAVIGHLRPFATGGLEWLRIWPNLGLFDGGGLLASGVAPGISDLVALSVYWAGCVLVCGLVAVYAFKHREF